MTNIDFIVDFFRNMVNKKGMIDTGRKEDFADIDLSTITVDDCKEALKILQKDIKHAKIFLGTIEDPENTIDIFSFTNDEELTSYAELLRQIVIQTDHTTFVATSKEVMIDQLKEIADFILKMHTEYNVDADKIEDPDVPDEIFDKIRSIMLSEQASGLMTLVVKDLVKNDPIKLVSLIPAIDFVTGAIEKFKLNDFDFDKLNEKPQFSMSEQEKANMFEFLFLTSLMNSTYFIPRETAGYQIKKVSDDGEDVEIEDTTRSANFLASLLKLLEIVLSVDGNDLDENMAENRKKFSNIVDFIAVRDITEEKYKSMNKIEKLQLVAVILNDLFHDHFDFQKFSEFFFHTFSMKDEKSLVSLNKTLQAVMSGDLDSSDINGSNEYKVEMDEKPIAEKKTPVKAVTKLDLLEEDL